MATLVVMHYPTSLFANLADHTYVKCGTGGKAWSCWGGKTGGALLRQGVGSTNQANAIAEPNERAGIRCYLINGVCHQAANRILFAAGITASRIAHLARPRPAGHPSSVAERSSRPAAAPRREFAETRDSTRVAGPPRVTPGGRPYL